MNQIVDVAPPTSAGPHFPAEPKRWLRQDDLYATPLSHLSWKPEESEKSLAQIFDHLRADTLKAASWYLKAKKPKGRVAYWARMIGILAAGVAGGLPLLSAVAPGADLSPLWVSIAVAVGAGALGFDARMNSSKGWVRYVKAEQQIRDAFEKFELEWQLERAAWRGAAPSAEQVALMIKRAVEFSAQINGIVQAETNAWGEEFLGSLKQLEDSLKARDDEAKARAASSRSGALNLFVSNGEQSTNGWKLTIDDRPETVHTGTTAAIADIAPGRHVLRVRGTITGKDVKVERIIEIQPNAIAREEMPLS